MQDIDYVFIERNSDRLHTGTGLAKLLNLQYKFINTCVPFNDTRFSYRAYSRVTKLYDIEEAYNFIQSDKGKSLLKKYNKERNIHVPIFYHNCKVTWLKRTGIFPNLVYTKHEIYSAIVRIKNNRATITTDYGFTFRKHVHAKNSDNFNFIENYTVEETDTFDFDNFEVDEAGED